jgi:D-psicose/D-tagatose/L-ribulose 3-epimerase
MRIAISNIAWDIVEDDKVASLLALYNIDAIDIAPGKYFPDLANTKESDILKVKDYWLEKGIELTGMQSLLFGTQGLNLFGTDEVQELMLDHLGNICRIAGILGSTRLVFGSPKNRDRSNLSDQEAEDIAVNFFRALGEKALQHDVTICLEPNPACYGANFMTTGVETFNIVKAVDHPSIKMQLDTGAITINNEDINTLLEISHPYIGHIHISEPGLAVIGRSNTNHFRYREAIIKKIPSPLISIEMVATKDEPHLTSIESALSFVSNTYRQQQ